MSRTSIRPVTAWFRTFPYLCKIISLAVLFGSKGNSYTICTQSEMCVYIYIYIQGVTGGTDNTSGGCSLGQTIPI
jgi:hypothetical protein